jgi:hypothetical protein
MIAPSPPSAFLELQAAYAPDCPRGQVLRQHRAALCGVVAEPPRSHSPKLGFALLRPAGNAAAGAASADEGEAAEATDVQVVMNVKFAGEDDGGRYAEAWRSLSAAAAGAAAPLGAALRELGSLARPVPAVAADAAAECVPLGAINSVATPADLAALSEREDVDVVVLGLFVAGATHALRDALGLAAFVSAAKAHARAEGGWCAQEDEDEDAVTPKRFAFAVARDDAALAELAAGLRA